MRRRNVAYIRLAHKDNDEVQRQKQLLEEYAKDNKFEIDYYYVDNGYPGNTTNRPQFRQMLRDVKSRKVTDRIVFKDITRIGRGQNIISQVIRQTSKRSVKLISTNELEIPMIEMTTLLNRLYNKDQQERKQTAQSYREKKGVHIVSPYKLGSEEDIRFKKEQRKIYKNNRIPVTFYNTLKNKKEVDRAR